MTSETRLNLVVLLVVIVAAIIAGAVTDSAAVGAMLFGVAGLIRCLPLLHQRGDGADRPPEP